MNSLPVSIAEYLEKKLNPPPNPDRKLDELTELIKQLVSRLPCMELRENGLYVYVEE